jgi:23S rRNA (cytosine1962-C5)-methyltransferase
MVPCVIFEDEHLLVVNKPAGWNTHAPGPYAGEGIYDWLRQREPRWAALAILHRLDKETSGVLVFGKTTVANRSLTEQFTDRRVRKKYVLLTDGAGPDGELIVKTALVRAGDKYLARPVHAGAELAETRFQRRADGRIEAEPSTGRTHQIRVHAAANGFPIRGDTLYGGSAAARVCLHAAEISFTHPVTGEQVTFQAPADFEAEARRALHTAIIEPEATDAYRLIHGASDGRPGWYVDRLGAFLLSQAEQPLTAAQMAELARLAGGLGSTGVYHKILSRQVRRTGVAEASPQPVLGEPAPERFGIRENGVQFELSFQEGYSVGLFLDQRDNRRRLLTGRVVADFSLRTGAGTAPWELLNVFAYTCGFSVCAAQAGAKTTSLDLSKKYLEWGRRNFTLNGRDPAGHDFIYGDAFDWLRRLAKKGRTYEVVVLDPPTFSQSKEYGTFRADKDYGRLVTAALPVLKPGGVLLAATNAADWPPEDFLAAVSAAMAGAGRKIRQQHYVPQTPDFPVSRDEPAYLKTVWVRS